MNLSDRTILRYVKDGRAGEPLQKRGPTPAGLNESTLTSLTQALVSYVPINLVNQEGHKNVLEKLDNKIKNVLHPIQSSR